MEQQRRVCSISEVSRTVAQGLRAGQRDGSWVRGEVLEVWRPDGWTDVLVAMADESGASHLIVPQALRAKARIRDGRGQVIEARVRPELWAKQSRLSWRVLEVDVVADPGPIAFSRARTLSRLADEGAVTSTSLDDLEYDRSLAGIAQGELRKVIALSPALGRDSWADLEAEIPKSVDLDRRKVVPRNGSLTGGWVAEMRKIRQGEADLVVLIRGGGSPVDFIGFDDYDLARAISDCPIPVATGIGHASNVSVADLVADGRFQTPTAVAKEIRRAVYRRQSDRRGRAAREREAAAARSAKNELQELRAQRRTLTEERDRVQLSMVNARARAQILERERDQLDNWVDRHLLERARAQLDQRCRVLATTLVITAVVAGGLLGASSWASPGVGVGVAAGLSLLAVVARRASQWPDRPWPEERGPHPISRREWRRRAFVAAGPRELRCLQSSAPVR